MGEREVDYECKHVKFGWSENATGESMKKNIPGLWLLLLDVAVALAGFCTGVHFFWKDQNEGGVVVAAAMSAAWLSFQGKCSVPCSAVINRRSSRHVSFSRPC